MPARSKRPNPDEACDLLLLAGDELDKENGYEKTQTKPVLWNRPLVLMLVVFWAVFKVLAPTTFGSPEKLATYMKSALIYAVGGCGLYFICVMGPFDMSVGANIVLSSIIACNASEKFGYAGLIIAPLICGTIIGLINGIVYIKLHISSLIVTCALSLIYEPSVYTPQTERT